MKKIRRKTIYEVKNVSTGEVYETNIPEIMEEFSISRNTVYYWIRKGILCGDKNLLLLKKKNQPLTQQKGSRYDHIGLPVKEQQKYNAEDNKPPINHYNEEWLPIHGYEDTYQISNYGNVYSNVSRRLLKLTLNAQGYLQVGLTLDGNTKIHSSHRLVAIHFLDNYDNSKRVTHLDGDKLNNKYTNLAWKSTNIIVAEHSETGERTYYNSAIACSRALNIKHSSILECLRENKNNNSNLITIYYA